MSSTTAPRTVRREGGVISVSTVVVRLTVALAAVVAVAAAVGLFAYGGPGPHEVITPRGQSVEVYGTGLYRHDSWLIGVGNRGTDAVTLFLEVPVLLAALAAYRRRSVRGTVVLIGVLGWLLYYYASMSLYTAYNGLFGLYVTAFGLALFAAPMALRSINPARFAAAFPSRPSRRPLVGYLGCLAAVLTVVEAGEIVGAMASFAAMTAVAASLLVPLLRSLPSVAPIRQHEVTHRSGVATHPPAAETSETPVGTG